MSVSNYNKKDQTILLASLKNADGLLYIVEGWFGEKLWEFLEGSQNLEQFLQRDDLKEDIGDTFKRLLVTLIHKELLSFSFSKESSISYTKPFLEEECLHFGTKNLKGCLRAFKIKEPDIEGITNLYAYSDADAFYIGEMGDGS